MNKYAAEKISSEYYNAGVQLALSGAGLGMNKTANKKSLLAGLAGVGAGVAGTKAAPGLMAKYEAMMLERANDAIRAAGPNMSMPGQLQSFASQVQPAALQGQLDRLGSEAITSSGARDLASMLTGGMGKAQNSVMEGIMKLEHTDPGAALQLRQALNL